MNKRNYTIDYLKAFATVLVVFDHCSCTMISLNKTVYFSSILQLLAHFVHVPLFFLLAGFLSHKKELSTYYMQKIYRVWVPFIFFTTLKILFSMFVSDSFSHGNSLCEKLINGYINGELYWFSYAILLMFFLIPFFWNFRKTGTIIFIFVCLFDLLTTSFGIYNMPHMLQIHKTILYLPFFLGGYMLKQYWDKITKIFINHQRMILVISVFLPIWIVTQVDISMDEPFPVMYLLAVLLSVDLFFVARVISKKQKWITIIAKYSYQVFLLDSFYRTILFGFANKLFSINELTVYLITIMVVILSCITCGIVEHIPGIRFLFGLSQKVE